jgi:hypothetical protein
MLEHGISNEKRLERVRAIFPTPEDFLTRYKPKMFS